MKQFWMMTCALLIAVALSSVSPPVSAHRVVLAVGAEAGRVAVPRACLRPRVCHALRVRATLRSLAMAERRADWRHAMRASRTPAEQDALALERLYRRDGKVDAAVLMYEEILARDSDPALRRLAHQRLALWALKDGRTAEAEAHLRANLDAALSR